MFEFLPDSEKKYLVQEYELRIAVTIMLLAAATLLVAIIVLLPALIALSFEEQTLTEKKTQLEDSQVVDRAYVTKINENLTLATRYLAVDRGEILEQVTTLFGEVPLTGFAFRTALTEEGREVTEISVTGVAPARENLLALQERFQENNAFTEIELPISVFAEESDIEFSLRANWQPAL